MLLHQWFFRSPAPCNTVLCGASQEALQLHTGAAAALVSTLAASTIISMALQVPRDTESVLAQHTCCTCTSLQEVILSVPAALQVPSDTDIVLAQLRMERRARTSVPVPPSTFAEDVAGITGQPQAFARWPEAAHRCPSPLMHCGWHERVSLPFVCQPNRGKLPEYCPAALHLAS